MRAHAVAEKCAGKQPYYLIISSLKSFGFDLIHRWLSSFIALLIPCVARFVLPVPVYETVPFNQQFRTSERARPVLDLLLMLPVDKRYASVTHLWNDPNKLSNMVSCQTYGRAI